MCLYLCIPYTTHGRQYSSIVDHSHTPLLSLVVCRHTGVYVCVCVCVCVYVCWVGVQT